ncbi:MAG: selenide, water dikinase SelD [Pseudomonadota bacterium]
MRLYSTIIGGGIAGVELSMAMAHAVPGAQVTVLDQAPDITGTAAAPRLHRAMDDLGVRFRGGVTIARIEPDHVALDDGTTIPAAFVTGAAGARPHPWVAQTALPVQDGFIRVRPDLSVDGRDDLFGAGDCVLMAESPRPKAGVYAVRAAPILQRNLRAALSGGRTKPFHPQAKYLKLVSLGGKDALAERGDKALSHPWLWRWKDRIDRKFMTQLTELAPMRPDPLPPELATSVREEMAGAKPLCAGCGSKVSGQALAAALAQLPPASRDDVLSQPGDDAAILRIGDARQVLTTDHLRAFTADPTLFARIATVHALGDIWAMGATPQAAVLTVILPRMSEPLQTRTLGEITQTVARTLAESGADLAGGHSMMADELSLGLAVTGLLNGPAIGLDGARPGDALLLTKPIGTGTILAAEMACRARGQDVMDMLAAMARPQGDAAAILHGAHAMTDVTGFGLAGHLANICRASGTGAEIALAGLPVYAGAEAATADGHLSVLHGPNRQATPVEGADGPRGLLLHDPQTAGGLLAAVAETEVDALLAQLRDAGYAAARIGRISDAPGLRAI